MSRYTEISEERPLERLDIGRGRSKNERGMRLDVQFVQTMGNGLKEQCGNLPHPLS